MIIGVSGKIKSGKDTVGRIIQELTTILKDRPDLDKVESRIKKMLCSDILNTVSYWGSRDKYKVKKFADKLKDIVCILIGCTREQLEDRDFKEKELGEEWWYYGAYQHGMSSDRLESIHADKKDAEYILRFSHMNSVKLIKLTPRKILQLLGTEAGRQVIHPNIWVNSLMADYLETRDDWVITDMRFPNELESVKNKNGITIRVNRLETDYLAGTHLSETALDDYEFDYIINNDGTLEDLIIKVKAILLQAGII